MASIVLGSTTVISDSSGTPTIQTGVGLPSGSLIKTYYAEYKRPYPRDACQTCTDAMEWKKLDEVVVKPYLFKTLDE